MTQQLSHFGIGASEISAVINWGDERLPERFWKKVSPEPMGGCWLWVGASTNDGYGLWESGISGQSRLVHRITFALTAEIPNGLEVDHRCRVRNCCNPLHLRALLHRDNSLGGHTVGAANAAKTHCPKGHAFTDGNVYLERRNGVVIGKRCRACKLAQQNAVNAARRAP